MNGAVVTYPVPVLFQMVSELRDHLLRHLQGVEKKKIEQMVLDYISKLVGFTFFFPNFNSTLNSMSSSRGVGQ